MTIIAQKDGVPTLRYVSLACFKAQGVKLYNLAEVGVEVGGRLSDHVMALRDVGDFR